MARSRNIKHAFFTNDDLVECCVHARLLFIGLWTLADREGRLIDRPRKIKAELFPYDDCDVDALLSELTVNRFIHRYEKDGGRFIQVVNFTKHQQPHYKEAPSVIPPMDGWADSGATGGGVLESLRLQILAEEGCCKNCGTRENLSIDHIVPRSRGGSHDRSNLQVLCRSCNSRKNNRVSTSGQDQPDKDPKKTPDDILIPDSGLLIVDSGLRKPDTHKPRPGDFAAWWEIYPHKVGKGDAEKKFAAAWLEAGQDELIAGVRRYIASKPPDRPWCNPATWLNQKRWTDQPQEITDADRKTANGKYDPNEALRLALADQTYAHLRNGGGDHRADAPALPRPGHDEGRGDPV